MKTIVCLFNIPAFYKLNLLRELRKTANVEGYYICDNSSIRSSDFTSGGGFTQESFLSHGRLEGRRWFDSLGSLIAKRKIFSRDYVIIEGWDEIEFWFVRLFFRPKRLGLILESTNRESSTKGIRGVLKRFFLRRVDHVYASGEPHAKLLEILGFQGRVSLVYGVGLHRWYENFPPARLADSKPTRYLYVGRLSAEKNLSFLVDLFRERTDLTLTVVGDGPLRSEIEKWIEALQVKNITLVGFVSNADMAKYYEQSSVIILPSHSETWGLVIEEAQHFGVPAIVADTVGCGPDIVQAYSFGFVARHNDLLDFIEKMGLLDQQYHQMIKSFNKDLRKRIFARYQHYSQSFLE